ncbi:relaxase/mobilization nuclease domain-containing protein [Mucilaginibacter sp. cycad4]|uniref:relaxase/mobilization nuclease domain-containing protein n=1 Tax=Mucilaginibacter sp. cycad4 TaxID=3342096 RepID=UPI002AAB5097|nr:relaxase/mobilization nuclease domain-containing protein [Mucilaginibacter gossypii]WPU99091.1 relaxase/mobilization nuclease domain-containing protein [Mucilaginibacter gossypii]
MIAKILPKPSRNFAGVNYNTNKIDRNKGELMRAANFGPLDALTNLRPQDYINYFQVFSARNKRIGNPQFHAVLSAKGQSYSKEELTKVAVDWLTKMGYGSQPYLIVFHKDTENNHVHIVSTRVGRDGKKISTAYEHVRSLNNLNTVLGYDQALKYRFSTKAQFQLVLESLGFIGRDYNDEKLVARIEKFVIDDSRADELKQLLNTMKEQPGFVANLKRDYNIELVFHSAHGKKPYGYTIIDHQTRQVFKGSEVLGLKYLHGEKPITYHAIGSTNFLAQEADYGSTQSEHVAPLHIGPVFIANDVDDQQVLGMKRRRQRKARTNTR